MEKQHYISHEQHQQLKQAWKKLSDAKAITAADVIIYNLLRGLPVTRGFSPATGNKIQGNDPWYAFEQAKWSARIRVPGGERKPERTERKKKEFAERFGMQCPEDFKAVIEGAKHE